MEKFFYKKIQAKREEELMNFKRKGVIEILLVFLYYITAPLLLTATIVTYMVINQTIDPAKVFTTMMVAVIFEVTALELPKASSQLLSVLKSIDRINAFLQAPEIDKRNY
jgi:energy-converting hydrogenase Eha subunit B